jgi:hypothetical protein
MHSDNELGICLRTRKMENCHCILIEQVLINIFRFCKFGVQQRIFSLACMHLICCTITNSNVNSARTMHQWGK